MKEEDVKVKWETNAGADMKMSEKWKEKHERRMRTVGICRGEKVEKSEEEKREEKREKEELTPLPTLDKINSLGDGWEW